MAGKLSLMESMGIVKKSNLVISADTGIIHVADLIGTPGISLIGPTAFGFPTGAHIKTLEVDLPCRPCTKDGRGNCSQKVYQKCMVDITPEMVVKNIN
jgi:heptosyltransferase-2